MCPSGQRRRSPRDVATQIVPNRSGRMSSTSGGGSLASGLTRTVRNRMSPAGSSSSNSPAAVPIHSLPFAL